MSETRSWLILANVPSWMHILYWETAQIQRPNEMGAANLVQRKIRIYVYRAGIKNWPPSRALRGPLSAAAESLCLKGYRTCVNNYFDLCFILPIVSIEFVQRLEGILHRHRFLRNKRGMLTIDNDGIGERAVHSPRCIE